MKLIKLIKLFFLSCILMPLSLVAENRTALLMGVWDYGGSKVFKNLNGIDLDLRMMEQALIRQGFTVYIVKNPTNEIARGAVNQFGEILKKRKGVGLFYFSGHGCEMDGHNYLCPSKSGITSQRDLVNKAMDAQLVLNRMQEAGISTKLVFLDCCRTSFKSGNKTFTPMKADGAFIGYATGAGNSSIATSKGSLYTRSLARGIGKPRISINDMHTMVTGEVKRLKPGQVPYQYSGLGRLFYFAQSQQAAPARSQTMVVSRQNVTKPVAKLNIGKLNHYILKNKVEPIPLTKNSNIYLSKYGTKMGLMAIQFVRNDLVKGSFFIPDDGREVKFYGDNYAQGRMRISLWESGSPIDGGELRKIIKNGHITWVGKLSSGKGFIFAREQARNRAAMTSNYEGRVGSSNVRVMLNWKAAGDVSGNYRSLASGNTYRVAGDNILKGFLYLEEFTNGRLSARMLLHKGTIRGRLSWKGTLYNVVGPRREVLFIKQ